MTTIQESEDRFGTHIFALDEMRRYIHETGPQVSFARLARWTQHIPGWYQPQVEAIVRERFEATTSSAPVDDSVAMALHDVIWDELETMRMPGGGNAIVGSLPDIERQLSLFKALGAFTIVGSAIPGTVRISIDALADARADGIHDRKLALAIERHLRTRLFVGITLQVIAGPVWTFYVVPFVEGTIVHHRFIANQFPLGGVPDENLAEIAVELDRRAQASPAAERHAAWWQRFVVAEQRWRAGHGPTPILPGCFCTAPVVTVTFNGRTIPSPRVYQCTGCRHYHCTKCKMPILSRDVEHQTIGNWWCAGCQAAGWHLAVDRAARGIHDEKART